MINKRQKKIYSITFISRATVVLFFIPLFLLIIFYINEVNNEFQSKLAEKEAFVRDFSSYIGADIDKYLYCVTNERKPYIPFIETLRIDGSDADWLTIKKEGKKNPFPLKSKYSGCGAQFDEIWIKDILVLRPTTDKKKEQNWNLNFHGRVQFAKDNDYYYLLLNIVDLYEQGLLLKNNFRINLLISAGTEARKLENIRLEPLNTMTCVDNYCIKHAISTSEPLYYEIRIPKIIIHNTIKKNIQTLDIRLTYKEKNKITILKNKVPILLSEHYVHNPISALKLHPANEFGLSYFTFSPNTEKTLEVISNIQQINKPEFSPEVYNFIWYLTFDHLAKCDPHALIMSANKNAIEAFDGKEELPSIDCYQQKGLYKMLSTVSFIKNGEHKGEKFISYDENLPYIGLSIASYLPASAYLKLIKGVTFFFILFSILIAIALFVRYVANAIKNNILYLHHRANEQLTLERSVKLPEESFQVKEINDLFNKLLSEHSANKSKIKFLKKLSHFLRHELRNPIAAIKLKFQLLKGKVEMNELSDELILRYSNEGLEKTNQMWNLVSEICDHNAIYLENIPNTLTKRSVELSEFIKYYLDNLALQTEISVQLRTSTNLIVNIDTDKITQLLNNIIQNAVDFSKQGYPVYIDIEKKDQWAKMSISNCGNNLPAGPERNALFEPFTSKRDKKHRHKTNIGIGLYLSKNIIESHGGRIEALDHRDNKTGATFTVSLPIQTK